MKRDNYDTSTMYRNVRARQGQSDHKVVDRVQRI